MSKKSSAPIIQQPKKSSAQPKKSTAPVKKSSNVPKSLTEKAGPFNLVAQNLNKINKGIFSYNTADAEVFYYKDPYCKLTKNHLTIYRYYLPCCVQRKLSVKKIAAVYYERQESCSEPCWGFGWQRDPDNCCVCHFCVFWGYGWDRQKGGDKSKNTYNVLVDIGECSGKGFYVSNIGEFLRVIHKVTGGKAKVHLVLPGK